jgi:nitrogen fixation/metabolism regulation signal transduction histidine kinase
MPKAQLESILVNLSAGVLAFDEELQLRSANRSAHHITQATIVRRSSPQAWCLG